MAERTEIRPSDLRAHSAHHYLGRPFSLILQSALPAFCTHMQEVCWPHKRLASTLPLFHFHGLVCTLQSFVPIFLPTLTSPLALTAPYYCSSYLFSLTFLCLIHQLHFLLVINMNTAQVSVIDFVTLSIECHLMLSTVSSASESYFCSSSPIVPWHKACISNCTMDFSTRLSHLHFKFSMS